MSMERSFPAHIPLISQTNEKNQNMWAKDMRDEEMALLLKEERDKQLVSQNQRRHKFATPKANHTTATMRISSLIKTPVLWVLKLFLVVFVMDII